MPLAARTALAAAVLAAALAGAAQAVIADRVGIVAAVALPVAAAVAVAVWIRPLLGVQLALLAVPLEIFSVRVGGSAGLTPTEMLVLLTAACLAVRWAVGERPWVPQPLRALLALCLAVALGVVVAEDQVTVGKILLMWSAFTAVGIGVANASSTELRRILICLAIGGGVAGIVAVAGGTDQSLSASGNLATNRAQASFQQPNVLAFFLTLAIPVSIAATGAVRAHARTALLVLAAAAVWGLSLTLSRTGLVGTALGLSVLLLWPGFRRVGAVALAALLLFSMINLDAIVQSRQVSVVSKRLATLSRPSAVEHDPRGRIYGKSLEMIGDHPLLGVGAGNFAPASKRYDLHDQAGDPYDHAHDVPLTVAVELGLPGILAFGWLVIAIGRLVPVAIRSRGDPRMGLWGLGIVAALVGITIPSLGDYPPRTNAIAVTFVVLVAALAAITRAAPAQRR